jgi:hypothetical protein
LSEADCDEFLKYLGGAEAEDRGSRARDHATSEAHNAMEAAAHSDPMERDEMPNYGANHMPRHALDSAPAWKAARAIAPGLANIKLGPIGWH